MKRKNKLCERQPIEIREKTSPLLFKFKLKQCFILMILQILSNVFNSMGIKPFSSLRLIFVKNIYFNCVRKKTS